MRNIARANRSRSCFAAIFVMATAGIRPISVHAQTPGNVLGSYELMLFGRDSAERPRALGRILLVLTSGSIPDSIAARLHAVTLDHRPPVPNHGACWRTLDVADTNSKAFWAAHTQWRRSGDSIAVILWLSSDASDQLRFTVEGDAVLGHIYRARFIGSRNDWTDSLAGSRVGPADPARC